MSNITTIKTVTISELNCDRSFADDWEKRIVIRSQHDGVIAHLTSVALASALPLIYLAQAFEQLGKAVVCARMVLLKMGRRDNDNTIFSLQTLAWRVVRALAWLSLALIATVTLPFILIKPTLVILPRLLFDRIRGHQPVPPRDVVKVAAPTPDTLREERHPWYMRAKEYLSLGYRNHATAINIAACATALASVAGYYLFQRHSPYDLSFSKDNRWTRCEGNFTFDTDQQRIINGSGTCFIDAKDKSWILQGKWAHGCFVNGEVVKHTGKDVRKWAGTFYPRCSRSPRPKQVTIDLNGQLAASGTFNITGQPINVVYFHPSGISGRYHKGTLEGPLVQYDGQGRTISCVVKGRRYGPELEYSSYADPPSVKQWYWGNKKVTQEEYVERLATKAPDGRIKTTTRTCAKLQPKFITDVTLA